MNRGESVKDGMIREVYEETGIKSELIGLLTIKDSQKYKFGCGDIYFAGLLRNLTDEIKMDPNEILDCQWKDLDYYLDLKMIFKTQKRLQDLVRFVTAGIRKGSNLNNIMTLMNGEKSGFEMNDMILMKEVDSSINFGGRTVKSELFIPQI